MGIPGQRRIIKTGYFYCRHSITCPVRRILLRSRELHNDCSADRRQRTAGRNWLEVIDKITLEHSLMSTS
ncbi:hypothetical protein DdX_12073 [Ditylenchus destructor]|uniref:Uncharacterized protein n=1 Tax=Ditylenchus destructor TaxID=166010 RepID=A0AAD4MYE3_9BILA|nr:hypothetical protein DdX_12073 [Ditylenchus destructor]